MVRTCNGTELQPQDYVGGRCPSYDDLPHYSGCRIHGPKEEDVVTPPMVEPHRRLHFCPDLQRAMESVHYIADHTRRYEDQMSVSIKSNPQGLVVYKMYGQYSATIRDRLE
ncbi:uncharacterized protein TNIN_88181 [Trichonephila inaurata madagascariensis]|uniref:Uncharacterized protein n=1 Tax=Trichonephila inaurata madagascariensis TaxID=2747483 RepID=A0A8X6XHL5_9ARAC|nr:uncharacterized protein TNIN_88181 [Trichonephila inaurata madagascariensis]